MENASKALVIAGTILISILVISVAVLSFNKMSDYQKSKSDLIKDNQISKFNEGFTQYIRNDTLGIDIITLANKVIDYNNKKIDYGVIDYNQTITLEIDMKKYNPTYGNSLFQKKNYIIQKSTDEFFKNIINKYTTLESKYTLKVMSALSSNIETLKKFYGEGNEFDGKTIEEVVGNKKLNNSELENEFKNKNFKTLELYSEYSEFKGAKFKGLEPEYKNGQITKLSFQYMGK